MWETVTGITGFSDALLGLTERWRNAKNERESLAAKRELGRGMTFYSASPTSYSQQTWSRYFEQHSDLATEFDRAATFDQYLSVFRRLGFIEGQPTEEQAQILKALVQANLDEGAKATQIVAAKIDDMAAQVGKLDADVLAFTDSPSASDVQDALLKATDRFVRASGKLSVPWQERAEVEAVNNFLQAAEDQRILVLTGSAGLGKSGVAVQVLTYFRSLGWPTLAFRLDLLSPTNNASQLGDSLELGASPVAALARVAEDRDCLLVIDQLDAVSKASGRHPTFFEVVRDLLADAERHPRMRVLLACREFDLANDDRFQELVRGPHPQGRQQALSPLSVEQVKEALAHLGFSPDRLAAKQLEILRVPLHLNLFSEGWTQQTEQQALAFQTVNDLYKLFTTRKEQKLREKDPRFALNVALAPLVQRMSDDMSLSLPEAVADSLPLKNELISEGILKQQGARISLFHEGYFDYLFARQFVAEGKELLSILLESEQHLFRRAQVRQVLTFLREQDRGRYLRTVQQLLRAPEVRFHLKELVYSLLWGWPDPSEEEWQIVSRGLSSADPEIAKFSRMITGSPAWTHFLLKGGVLAAWFESSDADEKDLAASALNTLLHFEPEEYLKFVSPYLGHSDEMDGRIASSLSWRLDVTSRTFLNFILQLFHRNLLDEHKLWMFLEHLSETQPDWAAEGVAVVLQRLIDQPRQEDDTDSYFGRTERVIKDEWHAAETFKRCATNAPEAFVRLVLPKMLALAEKYVDSQKLGDRFKDDMIWHYRLDFGLDHAGDVLLESVISALGQLVVSEFGRYAAELQGSDLEVAQYILLKGYILHAAACADEAINALCDEPERLRVSEDGSLTWLSFNLLRATTPHASPETLHRLEQLLINHTTRWERSKEAFRSRGWTEYRLLVGIAPERRSKAVMRRIDELARKFPDENPEVPTRTHWGGFVGSPIADQAVAHMSDEQWLSAMRKYDSDGMDSHKYTEDGGVTGGATQLAGALGAAAKKEPERFARLALRMPDDLHPAYFEHLVLDLRGVDLAPDLTLELARRCHALPGRPCGRWLPDLFGQHPEVDWPEEALRMVANYAVYDPDPAEDRWLTETGDRDPDMQGINSVRGSAAEALGNLLLAKKERLEVFRTPLEQLVHDPIVAVRVCAAYPIGATLNIEPNLAIEWFLKLADTRDEFLTARHSFQFMKYASQRHFDKVRPLIERMLESADEKVARAGAILACLAAFIHTDAQPLAAKVLLGSVTQRLGAAEVYSYNVAVPELQAQCSVALSTLFDDPDPAVREKTATFPGRLRVEEFSKYKELIDAFIGSGAFRERPLHILHQLEKSALRLPDTLLDSAEAYMLGTEPPTFGQGTRDAFYVREFGQLLFPLYTQHLNRHLPDETVLTRCLNLFDQMARWRTHEYYEGMQQVER